MMYPFMTLDDDTEIVHSEMKPDGREEIARYQKIVESTAHLILQFSQEGGVENAAGF